MGEYFFKNGLLKWNGYNQPTGCVQYRNVLTTGSLFFFLCLGKKYQWVFTDKSVAVHELK